MSIQNYIEICKQKRIYSIKLRKHNKKLEFFHASLVFNHNCFDKFITYGENQDRMNHVDWTLHAEEQSILKLKRNNDGIKKVDILVIRTTKNGSLNMSKPCKHCIQMMKNVATDKGYSVKNVYYTESNDVVVKTSLNKLLNDKDIHISKHYRRHL